jgi:3-methylcrotonyl-CoA carboxylase beta subunit
MDALVAELRGRVAKVKEGGGKKLMDLHRSRKKLPARERIDTILDPG